LLKLRLQLWSSSFHLYFRSSHHFQSMPCLRWFWPSKNEAVGSLVYKWPWLVFTSDGVRVGVTIRSVQR